MINYLEPKDFPVTKQREKIMNCLNEADRPLSCREIGKIVGHNPSALNNLNHSLVKLMNVGMVTRTGSRKSYVYTITKHGQTQFGLTKPMQQKALQKAS